ncbi:MAG: Ig-like domain-containing protein [Ignavibacteriales bacterium]|nr:MAG: Ig-like domain-containing protein [Ignavibacteriales bacterium]
MVKKSKVITKNIFLLLTGIIFSSCANQLPPGGGEVDKIPPEIIQLYPEDGTTNYSENYFELEFSEYVDKRTVKEAIFISPAIDGELELSWTGKSVEITFPSELRKNTTYVVTIGTDVVDHNNRNRMAQSFSFTFSTGDKIDRRMITGRVYDEKPDGVMMFAYKLDTAIIDPTVLKPDYLSQCGNDGSYRLLGLSAGTYRVFAVKDEFRDLIYNIEQDKIGVPSRDVVLNEDDSLFTGLNFFLTVKDTTPPRLLTAAMTDKHHILLSVSEEFDSSTILLNNFTILDSSADKIIKPKFIYRQTKKLTELVLVLGDSIPVENECFVNAAMLKDISGNYFKNDVIQVTVNDKPDTSKPGIVKTNPVNSSASVDYAGSDFSFFFSDAFDSNQVKQGINFSDTLGRKVDYRIKFPDDASLMLIPLNDLEVQKDYQIKIDLSKVVDIAGNKFDTTYVFKFKTISGLEFTGASGTVIKESESDQMLLILENLGDKKFTYKQQLSDGNKFNFERVEAGKYLLWAHSLSDSTNFNYGQPYPFIPSDNFYFYPDTLTLRPRWSLLDIIFNSTKKQ